MIERGRVVAAVAGSIDVRMEPGADAKCAECQACSRVDNSSLVVHDARDDMGAVPGDLVEIEIPLVADVRAGLIVYVMPVAALLLGYGIGRALAPFIGGDPDAVGAIFAMLGVLAGMMLMRQRARRTLVSEEYRPWVRAIITRGLPTAPDGSGRNERGPA